MNRNYSVGDFVEYVEPQPQFRSGSWHLAMARGGREESAADNLRKHRFEVYTPLMRVLKPVPQRQMSKKQRLAGAVVKRAVLRPIFPGYIFVRFSDNDPWRSHFDLAGVFGLVCKGDMPVQVNDAMVDGIKAQEMDGAVPGVVLMRQLFQIGETVRIVSGAFSGFTATVEELPRRMVEQLRTGQIGDIDESDRASLAVHIFGRLTPVSLPISEFTKM